MTELQKMEREMYKAQRKTMKADPMKKITLDRLGSAFDENQYGNKYAQILNDYEWMYRDYFYNLILNLITYKNAPITLDVKFCEYLLRTCGYCRIAGTDPYNVYVVDYQNDAIQTPQIGNIGWYHDTVTNEAVKKLDGSGDKLRQITRVNFMDIMQNEGVGYVLLSNKYNGYLPMLNNFNDFHMVDRVCKTLATIKATTIYNVLQMKSPAVGYSRNKNLTAKNIYEQIVEGIPFIEVDEDIGDITQTIGIVPLNVPNYLTALKQQFNNEFDELLTMLGINSLGIDKRERLVANEANSNAQLTEASANIYLDARNSQLELLNAVLGTSIEAQLNQESAKQLVNLRQEIDQSNEPKDTMSASPQSI